MGVLELSIWLKPPRGAFQRAGGFCGEKFAGLGPSEWCEFGRKHQQLHPRILGARRRQTEPREDVESEGEMAGMVRSANASTRQKEEADGTKYCNLRPQDLSITAMKRLAVMVRS